MKSFKKLVLVGALILTTSAALSACSIGDVADKFAGGVERFAEKHSKKITGPTVRKTLTNQTFDKIDATIAGGDIQIETGKEFAVKYHGKKKIIPKVTVQNGTLKLSQKTGNNFSINSGDAEVTIVVPKKMSSINALSEGGDISVNNDDVDGSTYKKSVHSANVLKVSAEGGDVDIE